MTCVTKPRAKDTSRGFKRTVAVPEGRKKMSCLSAKKGFGGGRQRATSTTEVQGVGGDMGQVALNFGGRAGAVSQEGTKKVVVTKREKHRP